MRVSDGNPVHEVVMAVNKGDRAPGFKLPQKPGQVIDVGEQIGKGKVVLLFFPLAFSPTCTMEMCAMRDKWKDWEALGVTVYGISVDSPFVTEKFRTTEQIPFPILSDFNRDVARTYGVLYEDLFGLKGVAKRAAFVIGRDGKVSYAWVSEDPGKEPNYDEVRSAVQAAA
jgi:peroxiredoxin